VNSLREEIRNILDSDDAYNYYENIDLDYCCDKILQIFEKQIDEKLQHVEDVLNDPRMTMQGCYNMKGKKEAFEEIKEMLK